MPTTTKGLSGFKSTGNPLLDALVIMSLVPGTGGMAADEEIGGDLGKLFSKLKPFKEGGEELPEASVENVEKILKEDPKAARGANVPKDAATRAKMIQEFLGKQTEAPASAPAAGPSLEQLSSPAPAKAVRAAKGPAKVAGGKPSPMTMTPVNQRFVNSVTEAQRQDALEPLQKLKQIYQHLRTKLPDTPRQKFDFETRIDQINHDEQKFFQPEFFSQLTTDPTPESQEFLRDLKYRYTTELERAQKTLEALTKKRQ